MDSSPARLYRLGDVEVDTGSGCLRRGGVEEPIRQKPYQVLLFFLRNRDRLVSKDELMAVLWPGVVVTEDAVVQAIVEVRRLLADDPRSPRFIKTVPKLGYRFVGEVEELRTVVEEVTSTRIEIVEERLLPPRASPEPASGTERRRRGHIAVAALGLAAVLAAAVGASRNSRPREGGASSVPDGRKGVVVLAFEKHSGGSELDWLSHGLADMLVSGLSQRPGLTVLSRTQLAGLLARSGRPEAATDLPAALDEARRANASRLVTGSFESMGSRLRVDAQILDAATGRLEGAESLTVDSPDELLVRVDVLARRLADRLGFAGRPASAALSVAMTKSLPAYHAYSLALEKSYALRSAEAIALLEKAVALDPGFAMAQARIGYVYCVVWGRTDVARPYLQKAWALADRLPEKDRQSIAAWFAIANGDFAGAIATYRRILAADPTDVEAHVRLAALLNGEERPGDALDALRRAQALDPASPEVANHLAATHLQLGHLDEALGAARRYVELAPTEPNARDTLGGMLQATGRYAEALAEFEAAIALDPRFEIAHIHAGNALAALGRYREAEAAYRAYLAFAPSDLERARAYGSMSAIALRRGDREAAERLGLRAVELSPLIYADALSAAVEKKDAALVARLDEVRRSSSRAIVGRGNRLTAREADYQAGLVAFYEGRPEDALTAFRCALTHPTPWWSIEPREDCLAVALLRLKRYREAEGELRRILARNPSDARAHYNLGLTLEALGDRRAARGELDAFLRLWKGADSDVPELADARRRLG
jgi:tetratricopeptide (TPR) repeat protein/DNA-binding winged helix-turn-helix (wHTH) protein